MQNNITAQNYWLIHLCHNHSCHSTIPIKTLYLSQKFLFLIVSITKFLILIGSAHAYLSRNWLEITWVSNYKYPITTICNWIPVIGQLRHSCVNCMLFNGFLHIVFLLFVRLVKHTTDFCTQRMFSKSSQSRNLLLIRLISNWTSCHTIQRVIILVISNRTRAARLSNFEITHSITPRIVLYSVQLLLLIIQRGCSPSKTGQCHDLNRACVQRDYLNGTCRIEHQSDSPHTV